MNDAERIKELEARVKELEAALTEANTPRWFYVDEEGSPRHSLEEAVEDFAYDLEPGLHLVEFKTARPCPTIWGVLRFFTEDDDEPWVFTRCATRDEALALLEAGQP